MPVINRLGHNPYFINRLRMFYDIFEIIRRSLFISFAIGLEFFVFVVELVIVRT